MTPVVAAFGQAVGGDVVERDGEDDGVGDADLGDDFGDGFGDAADLDADGVPAELMAGVFGAVGVATDRD